MKEFSNRTKILVSFFLLAIAVAWANVRVNNESIWNSTLDNSCVGCTTAAAGNFTTFSANHGLVNYITTNGAAPTTGLGTAGYTAFNTGAGGEMDFIAANGGSSPQIFWYYYLGSSLTKEMWLDTSAILHVPNGIVGNLTGNASTATNATTAGTTTGNAATATQFNSTPSNCGDGNPAYGVGIQGNALCPTTYKVQQAQLTSGICTTGNTSYSLCGPMTLNWPTSFVDGNYGVTCNTGVPTSTTGGSTIGTLVVYIYARNASNVQVQIQNGTGNGAGANTTAYINCTGTHI